MAKKGKPIVDSKRKNYMYSSNEDMIITPPKKKKGKKTDQDSLTVIHLIY